MALSNIQLATISPIDRAAGKFEVTVHSDDGNQMAEFDCDGGEGDARRLRDAIRDYASRLRRVADYRPRRSATANEANPAALLVGSISHVNNGGIEQLAAYLEKQPLWARMRFIERCSSLAAAVAERSAAEPTGSAS